MMGMTREEVKAKNIIINDENYGLLPNGYKTYAQILSNLDLHLTADPTHIGYMNPRTGEITLNRFLRLDQMSTIVRHEIVHHYLRHEKRLLDMLAKEKGWDGEALEDAQLKELRQDLYKNADFNIAGDYEISNRAYTDSDKDIVRNIRLLGKTLTGLVTEDDHPDWVNLTIEQMYDKLRKEENKDKNQIDLKDLSNPDESEDKESSENSPDSSSESNIVYGRLLDKNTFIGPDGRPVSFE